MKGQHGLGLRGTAHRITPEDGSARAGDRPRRDLERRLGGHHAPGVCLVDGGLVLDVGGMRGIEFDPSSATAVVGIVLSNAA